MRGNFPLWNRTLHFAWMSVLLSKQVSPSDGCGRFVPFDFGAMKRVCLCPYVFEWVRVNEWVHPSVSDFLMAVRVTEQVARSWDLLPIPGGDTPATNQRSNQRRLALKGEMGETTWIDHPLASRLISFNRWNCIWSNPKILTCLAL